MEAVMSGKVEKKARKAGKKFARQIMASALHEPFWVRLKIAWKIVVGGKKSTTKGTK
jgi:hypothetical protein